MGPLDDVFAFSSRSLDQAAVIIAAGHQACRVMPDVPADAAARHTLAALLAAGWTPPMVTDQPT